MAAPIPGARSGASAMTERGRAEGGARPSPWRPPLGGLGVREFLVRLGARISESDVGAYAAQLAYYLLFAMFPFLLFLAALLAYVPIPDLFDRIVAVLAEFLPEQAMER